MTTSRDQALSGGPELDRLLQTLPAKIEKNIMRAALRAGAAVMLKEVRQRVPKKTGDLAKTVRVSARIEKGQVTASVKAGGKHKGADAWYASLVEYGTRQHRIEARKERTQGDQSTGNDRLQIGGTFVGDSVEHSGARPRPFMRPAADAGFLTAVEAVQKKIRERLTAQGLNTPAPVPVDDPE